MPGVQERRSGVAPHIPWRGSLPGLLQAAAWIWMLACLLSTQKRVYQPGWLMTTLKYAVIGICHNVLIGVGAASALLLSPGSTWENGTEAEVSPRFHAATAI